MLTALAVHAQSDPAQFTRLTNVEVLEMVKAGISSDVLMAASIRQHPGIAALLKLDQ